MQTLCMLKGCSLVGCAMIPHGKDDPDPQIGKGSHSNGVTFAFSSLALIIVQCPWFAVCGLPSKLLQGITQGFDTAQPAMHFGVLAASKLNGRSASQGLQTGGIPITLSIIADLSQQAGGQPFACTRKTFKDLVVRVSQK